MMYKGWTDLEGNTCLRFVKFIDMKTEILPRQCQVFFHSHYINMSMQYTVIF